MSPAPPRRGPKPLPLVFTVGVCCRSPANFLDQSQSKGPVAAVFGLVFSKLAALAVAPDPLPFRRDTPAEIKGAALASGAPSWTLAGC